MLLCVKVFMYWEKLVYIFQITRYVSSKCLCISDLKSHCLERQNIIQVYINVFKKPIVKHIIRNKYTEFLAKNIWTAPQICVIIVQGS